MSEWKEIAAAEPSFAARVQALFDAHRHKTIATLRADGSPRISGIEAAFTDGRIVLGMMPGSVKAADLQRDPRLALHSTSDDPDDANPAAWPGDAKVSGLAVPGGGPEDASVDAIWFTIDIREVVLTFVGSPADHLVIESWHEGRGLTRRTRT